MPRGLWKGAISFGLVNVPVELVSGEKRSSELHFTMLDKRDMAPVGYQRINKRTGKAVEAGDIVKGYEYERGQYVLLTDEDFRQANPEATQTVEILGFVDVAEITPEYFETPYWLEAGKRGEKGYALLRQVLRTSHRAGIASMVISRKQHLATLLVRDEWLMLVTLRWADEVLAPKDMSAVPDGKSAVAAREVEMAQRLVDEMTQKKWDPSQYKDSYRDDLMARIDSRIKSGRTHELTPPAEEGAPAEGAKVIDLMTALRESLDRKGGKTKEAKEKAAPARRKRA
jgi:DNA end-binding protein Ku